MNLKCVLRGGSCARLKNSQITPYRSWVFDKSLKFGMKTKTCGHKTRPYDFAEGLATLVLQTVRTVGAGLVQP